MLVISTASLIGTTVVLLATTIWLVRRPISAALLVPGAWLVTIPVQAWVLAPRLQFQGAPREEMYISIAIANLAFVGFQVVAGVGGLDRLRQRLGKWAEPTEAKQSPSALQYWFGALLVMAIALAVVHWLVMPAIPLLQLVQGVDVYQLQISRENSAKLLAVPTLVKYAFTWNSRILLPILFTTAVLYRWRWMAVFVGVFGLVYTMSPLERLPSVLFLLTPFVAVAIRDNKRAWSPLVVTGVVVALLPALAITQILDYEVAHHAAPAVSAQSNQSASGSGSSPISPGSEFGGLPGPIAAALDLVLRRIGEGPTDVTYQWFAYFPAQHPYLYGSGWEPWHVLSSGYQTPANMVGLWAYYGKPGYDLTSLSAYGSFVADGWAEFGFAGVIVAALGLIALCVVLELVRALGKQEFYLACYAPPLVLIAIASPQAGLPAMVFSLGVFLVPLICFGFSLTSGRMKGVRGIRLAEPSLS